MNVYLWCYFFTFVFAALENKHKDSKKNLPVVLWHGLGDSYDIGEIMELSEILSETLDVYVHSVYLDKNSLNDRKNGFFGNVNKQIELVAEQLSNETRLSEGFNAIGFSQGGLFMRAYIERYNNPPVSNLITFGTPHYGISSFYCPSDVYICKMLDYFMKYSIWSNWIKENIVIAQYYRDTSDMEEYLQHNHFLPDINNEKKIKNATYAKNLGSLSGFIMVEFENDHVIIPKGSSHFNDYNKTEERVIYLRDTAMYKEDWLGLKYLDGKEALVEITVPGEHMEIDYETFMYIVKKYFVNSTKSEHIVQWQTEDNLQRN
ncbi:hypothetical protein T552_00330 [Pneumocystis carinii B80]|uniref:Palmitoyl-protein thioesterase 1 n=1 Tax=Pneumocystis carinii (strain B80) TaxID=1408658 RepID=A0A0W4ZQH1_PNEC8|nr:hypothetical protein T552_00330 [Pneumocystis carinii B80]KTW30614.1 hypothetical protein T552_00330 [Pneumocystis carinii B80]